MLRIITFGLLMMIVLSDASSDDDYVLGHLILQPDDPIQARYEHEGHIVACMGEPKETLKWIKPNGQEVGTRGRIHVEDFGSELRLIFDFLKLEDEGDWMCIQETDGSKKVMTLKVVVPISFKHVKTSVITAKEGHVASIPCKVTGNPEPTIQWFHNGRNIMDYSENVKSNDKSFEILPSGLLIRNVNRNHSGEYTCKAFQISEIKGVDTAEQTVLLDVHYKPSIVGSHHRTMYGFVEGEVNLTCEAYGEPLPNFNWYHNGRKIFKNYHNEYNWSVLRVEIKSKDDFGDYKCKAKNDLGHDDIFIKLQNGSKPNVPKFELKQLDSGKMIVDFEAKINDKNRKKMNVNGYRFEMIPKNLFMDDNESWDRSWIKDFANVNDKTEYLLEPLMENTTYLIRVASRNDAGFSDWSEVMEMTTLENFSDSTNKSPCIKYSLLPTHLVTFYFILNKFFGLAEC